MYKPNTGHGHRFNWGCGMRFFLNLEKMYQLCKFRGWVHPVSAIARETGFSRSYVSRIMDGKEEVTHRFMLAYIKAAGMNRTNYEWAQLFVIAPNESVMSMQSRNYQKFYGHIPYSSTSEVYPLRKEVDPSLEILRS